MPNILNTLIIPGIFVFCMFKTLEYFDVYVSKNDIQYYQKQAEVQTKKNEQFQREMQNYRNRINYEHQQYCYRNKRPL